MCSQFNQPRCCIAFCPRFQRVSTSRCHHCTSSSEKFDSWQSLELWLLLLLGSSGWRALCMPPWPHCDTWQGKQFWIEDCSKELRHPFTLEITSLPALSTSPSDPASNMLIATMALIQESVRGACKVSEYPLSSVETSNMYAVNGTTSSAMTLQFCLCWIQAVGTCTTIAKRLRSQCKALQSLGQTSMGTRSGKLVMGISLSFLLRLGHSSHRERSKSVQKTCDIGTKSLAAGSLAIWDRSKSKSFEMNQK